MDALRKSLVLLMAVMAIVCIVPLADDSSGSGDANGLLLYEVNPYGDGEGVSVKNYGSSNVDLRDYVISDAMDYTKTEGYITFEQSIVLRPGETAIICASIVEGDYFSDRAGAHAFGEDGVTKNRSFTLSDSGDDVYLFKNGTLIDAMFYGNKDAPEDCDYWTGYSVSIPKYDYVVRTGDFDTDSADDWFKVVEGGTNLPFDPDLKFDAEVTPFLFPDSGGIPIYDQLESAQESVFITMYQFGSANALALLCQLEQRGVEVTLLLEGEPMEGADSLNISGLKTLREAGGEIRLIGVSDESGGDKYSFVHAKYAIIDGDTVIVTSENWTTDNLNGSIADEVYASGNGNRGWGAVIESVEYAQYMQDVFDNDYSMEYEDVKEFDEVYPNARSTTLTYVPADDAEFRSYSAQVTPVLSLDNSYRAMEYYMANAKERIYAEQQSLGSSYMNLSESSPVYKMKLAAGEGVECKLILSSGITGIDSQLTTINAGTLVSAAKMSTPYVHNKGLICDDSVWVSSINWTDNSFNNNRETCVVIHSAEVADYYAKAFLDDFERNYTYDGFKIDTSEIKGSYPSGQEITFQVTVVPDGDYTYTWDLGDGSEPRVTDVSRIVCTPINDGTASAYVLKVTVHDNVNNIDQTVEVPYSVGTSESSDTFELPEGIEGYLYILVPLLVVIIGVIAGLLGRGKSKSKGKKSTKRRK